MISNYSQIRARDTNLRHFNASKPPMSAARPLFGLVLSTLLLFSGMPLLAQSSQPDAVRAVRAAVASEMQARHTDKSIWMYRDQDSVPGKDAVYRSIETRQGELRRMIELNGRPLSPSANQAEIERIQDFVNDPSAQAKARKGSAHDDAQAAELLKMLPDAFIWSIVSDSPEFLTLSFKPDPSFDPPDIEARIMGMMSGHLIVAHHVDRIRTLKGYLTQNVSIGFGLVKMFKGGTFDIERRDVGDGHWQITETHVHIAGHALFFKSIGTQQDEVKTEWKPSPDDTLEEAARTLIGQP